MKNAIIGTGIFVVGVMAGHFGPILAQQGMKKCREMMLTASEENNTGHPQGEEQRPLAAATEQGG